MQLSELKNGRLAMVRSRKGAISPFFLFCDCAAWLLASHEYEEIH